MSSTVWLTLETHLQAALSGAVLLGGVIGVHELGHYLAARWTGLRVLSFSVGFGPPLIRVRRHGVEYAVRLIPLGGYVNVEGEAATTGTTETDAEAVPRAGCSYADATIRQRALYAAAGPVASVLLAVLLFTACRWVLSGHLLGIADAFPMALVLVWSIAAGILHLIGATVWAALCGAPMTAPSVGGVIAVTRVANTAAHHGLLPFLVMAGVVSVNLGVMNLLPIPILDGGALAMLLAERVRGRPLSHHMHFWLTAAGGGVVACVILWSVMNDLNAQSVPTRERAASAHGSSAAAPYRPQRRRD
jgi:membrane-associated protease RseP (regulator of RpoE activity)